MRYVGFTRWLELFILFGVILAHEDHDDGSWDSEPNCYTKEELEWEEENGEEDYWAWEDPDGDPLHCYWNTGDYHTSSHTMNWWEAQDYCRDRGERLAVPTTWDKQNQAWNSCRTPHFDDFTAGSDDNCWIGLQDYSDATWWYSDWRWVDNQGYSWGPALQDWQTRWHEHEPNNWGGHEQCVHIGRYGTAEWNDEPCGNYKYAVCEPQTEWVNREYMRSDDSMSWHDGVDWCGEHGMTLAYIGSHNDNWRASDACGDQSDCWIGLNDREDEGEFEWTQGWSWYAGTYEDTYYTNWSNGEPNNSGNEDCAEIYANGTWNDLPCSHHLPALCSWDIHEECGVIDWIDEPYDDWEPQDEEIGEDWTEEVPEGWHIERHYLRGNDRVDWYDAEEWCDEHDMRMAFIGSDDDNGNANYACGYDDDESCWLGLSDRDEEGRWSWYSYDALPDDGPGDATGDWSYRNWSDGEPNNYSGNEDCAIMYPSGYWNDRYCDAQDDMFPLCFWDEWHYEGEGEDWEDDEDVAGYGCDDDDEDCWEWEEDEFHRKYYRSAYTMTWLEAKNWCESEGLQLAFIGNDDDQEYAHETCGDENCWIGLSDWFHNADAGSDETLFRWVHELDYWDSDEKSYRAFGNGQPDNSGNEDCVHMWSDGSWNDNDCDEGFYGMCSQDIWGEPRPDSSDEDWHDSHSHDWSEESEDHDGGYWWREYKRTSDTMTWTQGRDLCSDGYENGILAFIGNEDDQARAHEECGDKKCWIGLNDRHEEADTDAAAFEWVHTNPEWDSDELDYRAFDTHPNNIAGEQSDCVEMMNDGAWNDINCNSQRYALCATYHWVPENASSSDHPDSPDMDSSWHESHDHEWDHSHDDDDRRRLPDWDNGEDWYTCMIYCPYGRRLDEHGCEMCACNHQCEHSSECPYKEYCDRHSNTCQKRICEWHAHYQEAAGAEEGGGMQKMKLWQVLMVVSVTTILLLLCILTCNKVCGGRNTRENPGMGDIVRAFRQIVPGASGLGQGEGVVPSAPQLPHGWKSAADPSSGDIYYYHADGRVQWHPPKMEKQQEGEQGVLDYLQDVSV